MPWRRCDRGPEMWARPTSRPLRPPASQGRARGTFRKSSVEKAISDSKRLLHLGLGAIRSEEATTSPSMIGLQVATLDPSAPRPFGYGDAITWPLQTAGWFARVVLMSL